MTERRLISTGSSFEEAGSFSRALTLGPWCFVSGTTGYDYATMRMPDSVEAQARNTLQTIGKVLTEAGFGLEDVVRVQYYVADAAYSAAVFSVAREVFKAIRPAATLVVCGLIEPVMKVEIEATAFRP